MRLLFNLLFVMAVGGAWAWYHVDPPEPPVRYRFDARRDVPGYTFKPEAVTEKAARTLATTNLFNGFFFGPQGQRISAFLGEWRAENSKEMGVVSHTPDICWVGVGWQPVSNSHPSQVEFEFQGKTVPFEVRTFRPPAGGFRELTVWCTLVNGQPYSEVARFSDPESDAGESPKLRQASRSRYLAGSQFLNAVSTRTAGTGDKQFIRFSAPVAGDWQPVLDQLRQFARQWLEVREDRSKG